MITTLYPYFQAISKEEMTAKMMGVCGTKYGERATSKQIEYIAALCVRSDASRMIFQDWAVSTSGALPVKKASRMIEKLLAI